MLLVMVMAFACYVQADVVDDLAATVDAGKLVDGSSPGSNENHTSDAGVIWTAFCANNQGDDDVDLFDGQIEFRKKVQRGGDSWIRGITGAAVSNCTGMQFSFDNQKADSVYTIKWLVCADDTWYVSDAETLTVDAPGVFTVHSTDFGGTWDQVDNQSALSSTTDGDAAALTTTDTNTTLSSPTVTGGGYWIILPTGGKLGDPARMDSFTWLAPVVTYPQASGPTPGDETVVSVADPNVSWTDSDPAPVAVRVFSDVDGGGMVDISGIIAAGVGNYGPISVGYDQVVQWQVRSYSDAGGTALITDGDGYATWSFTGPPAVTGMSPVDEIVATRNVTLSWRGPADANSYGVIIDGAPEVFVVGASELDSFVAFDATQSWSIIAYADVAHTIPIGAESATESFTGPTLIQEFNPTDGEIVYGGTAALNWNANDEATSFHVFFGEPGAEVDITLPDGITESSLAAPALELDTDYSWYVACYDAGDALLGTSPAQPFTTGPLSIVQDFDGVTLGEIYNGTETPRMDPVGYTWGGCTNTAGDGTIDFFEKEGYYTLRFSGNAIFTGAYAYSIFDPNLAAPGNEDELTMPSSVIFSMYNDGSGQKSGDDGRLIIRDAIGRWYLADDDHPLQAIKGVGIPGKPTKGIKDCTFDITTETWKEIVGDVAAHMNDGVGEPNSILDNLDPTSTTPNLLSITGGGVMIDTETDAEKRRNIYKITWIGEELSEQVWGLRPLDGAIAGELGLTATLSWQRGLATESYQVQLDSGSGFANVGSLIVKSGNSDSLPITLPAYDTVYTWRVLAYSDAAGTTLIGALGDQTEVTLVGPVTSITETFENGDTGTNNYGIVSKWLGDTPEKMDEGTNFKWGGWTLGSTSDPTWNTPIHGVTEVYNGLLEYDDRNRGDGGSVYTIFSSAGINTPNMYVPNLKSVTFDRTDEGGDSNIRLLVRDIAGDWFLSETVELTDALGDQTFGVGSVAWEKITGSDPNTDRGNELNPDPDELTTTDMNELDDDGPYTYRDAASNADGETDGCGPLTPLITSPGTPDFTVITGGGFIYVNGDNTFFLDDITWNGEELPTKAYDAYPNGGVHDPWVGLSWKSGDGASVETLEFGEAGAMAPVTITTPNAYDPGMLDLGKTYEWRVTTDGVPGDTYSFDVTYLVVIEDFQYFDSDAAELWSGSYVVDHNEIANSDIMAITDGAATFTYDPPVDWTVSGITALLFSAQGTGSLVVNINGVSAGATNVGELSLEQTTVFLSELDGVDLENVSTIELVATGHVIVDNILLALVRCESFFDVDGDCIVGPAELAVMATEWLSDTGVLQTDFVTSGKVDIADFAEISAHWMEQGLWY